MKMKDVRPYSVWTGRRWLLTHPWAAIKEFFLDLRAGYWRSKYGFAPRDVWNFDSWFLEVVPQMLKYLAENGCGYPDNEKFPTPESWKDHLLSISNMLENAREEVRDQKNEYYPAYLEKNDEITKKYFERARQLAEEQDTIIEEALKLLASTPLKAIWD